MEKGRDWKRIRENKREVERKEREKREGGKEPSFPNFEFSQNIGPQLLSYIT